MTLQTALMTIGQYLLLAIGLILLLFIIVLAVAFLLTLFMRFFADISFKTVDGEVKKLIRFRFKFLFYEKFILNIDDSNTCPVPDSAPVSGSDSVQKTDSISDAVSAADTAPVSNTDSALNSVDPVSDPADPNISESENKAADHESGKSGIINEIQAAEECVESEVSALFESYDEVKDEVMEALSHIDLPESFAEMKAGVDQYVDLSNPEQFISDSIRAAILISKATARFAGDMLLRIDIDKMNADVIYGLSNPADTALSFGAVHSFKASVYAYLVVVEEKSKSSKKRKKAAVLGSIIRDDIHIVPDLTEERFEADADMSFSFWIPRAYIPTLRFLLNKNTRWVVRRYLYPYYIRHYIRMWRAERKQRKAEKKI